MKTRTEMILSYDDLDSLTDNQKLVLSVLDTFTNQNHASDDNKLMGSLELSKSSNPNEENEMYTYRIIHLDGSKRISQFRCLGDATMFSSILDEESVPHLLQSTR